MTDFGDLKSEVFSSPRTREMMRYPLKNVNECLNASHVVRCGPADQLSSTSATTFRGVLSQYHLPNVRLVSSVEKRLDE